MKTHYKYIQFSQYGQEWLCINNKTLLLGHVVFVSKWREWEFCPEPDCGFSIDCVRDIADFLGQLNQETKAKKK